MNKELRELICRVVEARRMDKYAQENMAAVAAMWEIAHQDTIENARDARTVLATEEALLRDAALAIYGQDCLEWQGVLWGQRLLGGCVHSMSRHRSRGG